MASRYRNDYIGRLANAGLVCPNSSNLLVNKTSEESRARFENIMNSLVQKHEEEKEPYTPPPVTIQPVRVKETYYPEKTEDEVLNREKISFRKEPKKDQKIAVVVVVILVFIMFIILFKMYETQKLLDNLIREEVFQSRQYPF